MSDVDRLLAAFDSGGLLRPSAEVPNITDLSRAIALLGEASGVQHNPGSTRTADLIGPARHLLFVLADGLGMSFIEELPEDSFLSAHCAGELRTVFPSATGVALTSVATGEWPGRHAVTGWWTHLPDIGTAATILPFVRRSDGRPLADLGVTPDRAFPLPSVVRSVKRDSLALLPDQISGSVYSVYFSGGRARRGYRSLHEAVDIALERVRNSDEPTYTYLYTPRVDGAAHRYGTRHPEVRSAILGLDRQLERLEAGLAGRGRIVVSADHGFLDAGGGATHQIRASDPLMSWLRVPPSGDARVVYLHVRQGACDRVRHWFREEFGGRFMLVSLDEAEHLRLFGPDPLSPQTRERMGDLIAISTGPDVIEYRPPGVAGRIAGEVSHHSGLTPSEMRVPLIIA